MIPLWAALVVAALASALGRRIAGGLWGNTLRVGDTPVRVFWGATVALGAWLGGLLWWHALILIPAVWAGAAAFGLPWQAMIPAQLSGTAALKSVLGGWYHGIGGMILPAAVAVWWPAHPIAAAPFFAAGALLPLCYALAQWIPVSIQALGVLSDDRPPLGELLWGALVGVAAVLISVV